MSVNQNKSMISTTPPPSPLADDTTNFTPRKNNSSTIRRKSYPRDELSSCISHCDINDQLLHISLPSLRSGDHDKRYKAEVTVPLTWNEARARLKVTLENWITESKLKKQKNYRNNSKYESLILEDQDMTLLSVPVSVLFAILSFLIPTLNLNQSKQFNQHHSFQTMQQTASLLFLMSSLLSVVIAKRRRKVSREADESIERRRCISIFLDGMRSSSPRCDLGCNYRNGKNTAPGSELNRSNNNDLRDIIPRKYIEGIYSAYRLQNNTKQNCRESSIKDGSHSTPLEPEIGQWHRIPSLLLVHGDFIALKVGDTAPARCCAISTAQENAYTSNRIINKGERLTVSSLSPSAKAAFDISSSSLKISSDSDVSDIDAPGRNKNSVNRLPIGKSTVKFNSDEMLLLANGIQTFVLLETPLESFLKRDDIVTRKSPQLIRQGQAIRSVFLFLSFISFITALIILLIRPYGAKYLFQSYTWTLPMLSAFSFLPVMTPFFLFCLECVGTARILATVHPLASSQKQRLPHKSSSDPAKIGTARARNVGSKYTTSEHRLSLSLHSISDYLFLQQGDVSKPPSWLLFRYLLAIISSRLFIEVPFTFWRRQEMKSLPNPTNSTSESLLTIPPSSLHLLEKLGLVTAIALIDDELACDPYSTPQQLLIPSKDGGLKLLDLCPVFNEEDEYSTDEEDNQQNNSGRLSSHFRKSLDEAPVDSDDDSHEEETRFNHSFSAPSKRLLKFKKRYRKKRIMRESISSKNLMKSILQHSMFVGEIDHDIEIDVQFEDPQWWQYLPSLKCLGLCSMLIEERVGSKSSNKFLHHQNRNIQRPLSPVEAKLLNHLCIDRERKQLRVFARCIGFSNTYNELGPKGDLSSFREKRRLHIISADLLRKRMQIDSHAMGLEESRNWSRLQTDVDSVFIQDSRSGGHFLLTVGDARVVTELCPDWWQGENSTISPLISSDRNIINETQNNWLLSDLDVQAFSYAPLPHTADHKIGHGCDQQSDIYLLDNPVHNGLSTATGFWSLIKNQIFLGLLGSSVRPRKEIEPFIIASADAGVRFVYFSPRNMRRTKELASQMGIDVAWNCAISLRPLEDGRDDSFRMTSNYADWDVNARLPHGVDAVKRHLKEVDNVPLLVSIYTDVTKTSTAEMVNVFQEYHDTVLSIGLSHLPGNQEIFKRSDIAIGVDVFAEEVSFTDKSSRNENSLLQEEIAFVASISAHSSVFNLWGHKAVCHLLEIIRIGRASLEAVSAAVYFVLTGLTSFGIFIVLCPCTMATAVPTIPSLGSFLYTQVILLGIGLSMAMTDGDKDQMTRVPPKNDLSAKYTFKESKRLYMNGLLRAAPASIIPQFLYPIVFSELLWEFDSEFVQEFCIAGTETVFHKPSLASIMRCEALRDYSGPANFSAGTIMLASHAVCVCLVSASFVFRTEPILNELPWKRNYLWVGSLVSSFILIAIYLAATLEKGSIIALPWFFFGLFILSPFICLWWNELVKKADRKHENRAVMMRRLQFETKLGMWSPKESTHVTDAAGHPSPRI